MKQLNEQLKDSIEAKTGTRPEGYTLRDILNSASGEDNATLVDAVADFIDNLPGGGATAPTISKEITWDGNTEGLESHTVTLPGDEPVTVTMYKVSDSVLPYGFFDSANGYTYEGTDQSDEAYTDPKVYAFDGYVALGGAFDVISAYFDNFVSEAFGDEVLVPSVGTWFKKDGTEYLKSITATLDI